MTSDRTHRPTAIVGVLALIAALLAALIGPASPAGATQIAADAFGYTAWDSNAPDAGPSFAAVDISGTGTDLGLTGDGVDVATALEAPFNFYGTFYDALRVGSFGIIGFGATTVAPDLSNDCPLPATPSTGDGARIYPLHDDLIVDGTAYYEYFDVSPVPNFASPGVNEPAMGASVIQFTDVHHFGVAGSWDMWVILYDDGDITVQIGAGNPELGSGSTTGIQNGDASIGLTTVCNSANSVPDNYVAHFEHPGLDIPSPIVVDTTDDVVADDGLTSLREAITLAGYDGVDSTIELAPGATYTLDECGGDDPAEEDANVDGDLDSIWPDDITINGHGATLTTTCQERLINNLGDHLTIRELTLTGGETATGVDLRGGGAIETFGPLTLEDSTVHGNSAPGSVGGGLLSNPGELTLVDTAVFDNVAVAGGGIASTGPATITRSSVTGNTATGAFGGGAVALDNGGDLTVVNSTLSGNTSATGAAVRNDGGDVTLTHATVVGNSTTGGSAGDVTVTGGATVLTSTASIIAESAGAGANCVLEGSTTSNGHNLTGDGTCGLGGATDLEGTPGTPLDPQLGPLEFGSPGAHVPEPGSPVIDVVPAASCGASDDLRGTARPQGAGCEIGAIEIPVSAELNAAGRFVPLPPTRILDTRTDHGDPGPKGFVGANSAIDVQVAGAGGVPNDAIAVVMNVTATESAAAGFVTAWPKGEPRPNASNLNLTEVDQTRPNLVTVPIGADGKVSLYTPVGHPPDRRRLGILPRPGQRAQRRPGRAADAVACVRHPARSRRSRSQGLRRRQWLDRRAGRRGRRGSAVGRGCGDPQRDGDRSRRGGVRHRLGDRAAPTQCQRVEPAGAGRDRTEPGDRPARDRGQGQPVHPVGHPPARRRDRLRHRRHGPGEHRRALRTAHPAPRVRHATDRRPRPQGLRRRRAVDRDADRWNARHPDERRGGRPQRDRHRSGRRGFHHRLAPRHAATECFDPEPGRWRHPTQRGDPADRRGRQGRLLHPVGHPPARRRGRLLPGLIPGS